MYYFFHPMKLHTFKLLLHQNTLLKKRYFPPITAVFTFPNDNSHTRTHKYCLVSETNFRYNDNCLFSVW